MNRRSFLSMRDEPEIQPKCFWQWFWHFLLSEPRAHWCSYGCPYCAESRHGYIDGVSPSERERLLLECIEAES